MVAERRIASPENYAYLALLLSLLRPDLQGHLKLGQDSINSAITNPYNLTGLAFGGTAPYGTNYGNNNFIPSKQAIAGSGYFDPLSQYLGWQPNAQFDNNGIAMILGDTQVRNHLDSESGYSSADEVGSPLSRSSFSAHSSPRQLNSPFDDLSELGAAGYTPPSLPSLEDYIDLEYLANVEPNKGTKGGRDVTPDLSLPLKQEPNYLDNILNPTYSTEFKTSRNDINGFPDNFEMGLETKEFDPLAVDFAQSFTNNSFQYPFENDLESMINFDELATLDFNLPSDVLTTDQSTDQADIESQLESLIQTTSPARNGSGGYPNELTTVTLIDKPKKLTNIPTNSNMAVSNKKIANGKKKVSSDKKITTTKSKSIKTGLQVVDITDDAIIDMAVNEFNAYLETLTEQQAKYVRDVRRRGKNKEAARVCRKRKLEAIDDLEDELKKIKLEKQKVLDEQKAILEETAALKLKISELEEGVFNSLKDDHGRPLSRREYSLFQADNGTMFVGKNIDSTNKQKST